MKTIRTIILEEGAKYGAYIYVGKSKSRGTSSYIVVRCAECGVEKEVRKYDFRLSTQQCFSCGYSPGRVEIPVKIRKKDTDEFDPEYVYCNAKTVKKVFDKYNNDSWCNICKISEWMGEPLHMDIDHIIPIHLGGENKLKNLQRICPNCHRLKTKKENFGNQV